MIQRGSEEFSGADLALGTSLRSVRCSLGVASPGPVTMTGRNAICAEVWMSSRVSADGVPGRDTTMLLPDWVVISASETPAPSTRWRMISTAWSSCSWVISCPACSPCRDGVSTICVPPSRSRASLGAQPVRSVVTPYTSSPASRAMTATSATRDPRALAAAAAAPVRGFLVRGDDVDFRAEPESSAESLRRRRDDVEAFGDSEASELFFCAAIAVLRGDRDRTRTPVTT